METPTLEKKSQTKHNDEIKGLEVYSFLKKAPVFVLDGNYAKVPKDSDTVLCMNDLIMDKYTHKKLLKNFPPEITAILFQQCIFKDQILLENLSCRKIRFTNCQFLVSAGVTSSLSIKNCSIVDFEIEKSFFDGEIEFQENAPDNILIRRIVAPKVSLCGIMSKKCRITIVYFTGGEIDAHDDGSIFTINSDRSSLPFISTDGKVNIY